MYLTLFIIFQSFEYLGVENGITVTVNILGIRHSQKGEYHYALKGKGIYRTKQVFRLEKLYYASTYKIMLAFCNLSYIFKGRLAILLYDL